MPNRRRSMMANLLWAARFEQERQALHAVDEAASRAVAAARRKRLENERLLAPTGSRAVPHIPGAVSHPLRAGPVREPEGG